MMSGKLFFHSYSDPQISPAKIAAIAPGMNPLIASDSENKSAVMKTAKAGEVNRFICCCT